MPPKRKSALSSSTSKPAATSAQPSSSDGPTLPIISATPHPAPAASIPTKRKAAAATTSHAPADERGGHTLHPQLYTPWQLLPPQLQAEMRKANGDEVAKVVPVAWSKNQNVRGGVNRVKAYLGFGESAGTETGNGTGTATAAGNGSGNGIEKPPALNAQDGVFAVSAQGEGTAKLIGILEVAKRVVEGDHGDEQVPTRDWFVYTALSCVAVPVRVKKRLSAKAARTGTRGGAGEEGSEEESDDAFETPVGSRGEGGGEGEGEKMRKEPVLTVWFWRGRNAGFERAFGEVVWRVRV